jgi:dipeptidyl aminopeptidase/acylaminoacyl peptidase
MIQSQGTIVYSAWTGIYAIDLQDRNYKMLEASTDVGGTSKGIYNSTWITHGVNLYYSFMNLAETSIYRSQLNGNDSEYFMNLYQASDLKFSPSGDYIARYGPLVGAGGNDPLALIVTNIVGGGTWLVRKDEINRFVMGFSWSPDNQQLAYLVTDQPVAGTFDKTSKGYLFIHNLPNNQDTKIGIESIYLANPAWSPQGEGIALSMEVNGQAGIFLASPVTDNVDLVTMTNITPVNIIWSPDGKMMLLELFDKKKNSSKIALLNVETKQITTIDTSENGYFNPIWSPDGKQIAFFTSPDNSDMSENAFLQLTVYQIDNEGIFTLRVPGYSISDFAGGAWVSAPIEPILHVGGRYMVTTEGNQSQLYEQPEKTSNTIGILHTDEIVSIIGGPQIADTIVWRQFQTEDGVVGWGMEIPGWYVPLP